MRCGGALVGRELFEHSGVSGLARFLASFSKVLYASTVLVEGVEAVAGEYGGGDFGCCHIASLVGFASWVSEKWSTHEILLDSFRPASRFEWELQSLRLPTPDHETPITQSSPPSQLHRRSASTGMRAGTALRVFVCLIGRRRVRLSQPSTTSTLQVPHAPSPPQTWLTRTSFRRRRSEASFRGNSAVFPSSTNVTRALAGF